MRLYAPNLKSIDLFAPGYYFLTTDTDGLCAGSPREAESAGARIIAQMRLSAAERQGNRIHLPQFAISTRYLVGADGARSTVARLFDLGRNRRFLIGLEARICRSARCRSALPPLLSRYQAARRGYLAWVAPAPGFFQVGLATNSKVQAGPPAFLDHTDRIFGFSRARK